MACLLSTWCATPPRVRQNEAQRTISPAAEVEERAGIARAAVGVEMTALSNHSRYNQLLAFTILVSNSSFDVRHRFCSARRIRYAWG